MVKQFVSEGLVGGFVVGGVEHFFSCEAEVVFDLFLPDLVPDELALEIEL